MADIEKKCRNCTLFLPASPEQKQKMDASDDHQADVIQAVISQGLQKDPALLLIDLTVIATLRSPNSYGHRGCEGDFKSGVHADWDCAHPDQFTPLSSTTETT